MGKKLLRQLRIVRKFLSGDKVPAVGFEDLLGPASWRGTCPIIVASDASISGFGFVGCDNSRGCKWFGNELWTNIFPSKTFTCSDICVLELLAAVVAVGCCKNPENRPILVLSDNTATVNAVNKRFSSAEKMMTVLENFIAHGASLRGVQSAHVEGKLNWLPDILSRGAEPPIGLTRVATKVLPTTVTNLMHAYSESVF